MWQKYFKWILVCLFRKNVLIGCPGWWEKEIFLSIDLLRDCILDSIKRDTNVTGKRGQNQPYFNLFVRVIFIIMTHIEMRDSLWYPKIFLVHSIGLQANLIAIGNGKSLYRPSGTVFVEMCLEQVRIHEISRDSSNLCPPCGSDTLLPLLDRFCAFLVDQKNALPTDRRTERWTDTPSYRVVTHD